MNQYVGVLAPHLPQRGRPNQFRIWSKCPVSLQVVLGLWKLDLHSRRARCRLHRPDTRHRVTLDPITASRPPFGPPILSQVANAASAAAAMVEAGARQHP